MRKPRIKYRKKLKCPVCYTAKRAKDIKIEYLKPMREDQPHIQFVILGKCGHQWKMSADEMGYDKVRGILA